MPTDSRPPAPPIPRTGIGTDVHAFAPEASTGPLHLACLEWPGEPPLEGHSDGDVVAHACCDALLSAAGLGDLGSNFGTSEPQWKGAAGATLLAESARRVRAAGFEIGNVAVQLMGARPRVGARSQEATTALSRAAGAPVSFTATTTDHLGFLGRQEGLAAIATALLHPPAEPPAPSPQAPEDPVGGVHHIELWVGDLGAAREQWGWLLGRLGWERDQDWPEGTMWRSGAAPYLVLTTPPLTADKPHDRRRPGLNHLALQAPSRFLVDLISQQCSAHGWRPLYAERYPFAGGPDHYAAYLEDSQGFKVEVVAAGGPRHP